MQGRDKPRCPFLKTPFADCYVADLSSSAVEKVISYCGANFEKCEIYVREVVSKSHPGAGQQALGVDAPKGRG